VRKPGTSEQEVDMSRRVVHFEIPFDDGDRARAFYSEAFGWQVQQMPELDYTMAASGPMTESGMPSEPGFINGGMFRRSGDEITMPVITIDVGDIDAALQKIEELGGTVVQGRQAVADMGFTGYFRDTEGNVMGLWQTAQAAEGDA
jgi:predicted enzyme related to lactoylglutathione lyase